MNRLIIACLLTVSLLTVSLFLCVGIRTANLPRLEEKYLLGIDAYHFLRQADIVVSQGSLPEIDTQRWAPEGRSLSSSLNLFSYVLAYSYRLLHWVFPEMRLWTVAVYAPVVCYALCLLVLYALWRRIFEPAIALLAVNFTAVLPTLNLHRSCAGFADRDAFVLLLWLLMFLFYLKTTARLQGMSWRNYLYASISALLAGILALTWEGVGLATGILAVWMVLRILRGSLSGQDAIVYSIWYLCFIIPTLALTPVYHMNWHTNWQPYAFLALVFPTVVFFSTLTFLFPKMNAWFARRRNLLRLLFGSGIGIILLVALAPLTQCNGQSVDIFETCRMLLDNFISPLGGGRLMQSTAELAALRGTRLIEGYSLPILAAMLIGSVLLAYQFFSAERAHFLLAMLGFEILLCGTLISVFITDAKVGLGLYGLSLIAGGVTIAWAFWLGRTRTTLEGNRESSRHCEKLFVLVWLLIGLFSSRGAERYLFFFAPVLALLCSFLAFSILRACIKRESAALWASCVVILFTSLIGISTARLVASTVKPHWRGLQARFADIAARTDENATIAAWWDYGSQLNWFAKRTTVVDAEHHIRIKGHSGETSQERIVRLARDVFAGTSPTDALAFLRAHHATHLLITTNDLGRLETLTYTGEQSGSVLFLTYVDSQQQDTTTEVANFIPHARTTIEVSPAPNSPKHSPKHWQLHSVSIAYHTRNASWSAILHGTTGAGEPFSLPPREFRVGDSVVVRDENGIPGTVAVFPNRDGSNHQAFYVTAGTERLLAVRLYLFLEDIPGFRLVDDTNAAARCEPDGLRLWEIDFLSIAMRFSVNRMRSDR